MGNWLLFAFLFFIGSCSGWVLELFYRKFVSGVNPQRKWINPGFLAGPCLPIYGLGLCILYLLSESEKRISHVVPNDLLRIALLIVSMCVCMTLLELVVGLLCLKFFHLRLWDYREQPGNFKGIICPRFSVYWTALGVFYFVTIHPHVQSAVEWLRENLEFSFFVGMFFGIFFIDLAYSANIVVKIKRFAYENDVILRYEQLKSYIRSVRDERRLKIRFLLPLLTDSPFADILREYKDHLERLKDLEIAFRKK